MKEIEITVLMSVYNTAKEQLKYAIESILNQTYKNFEFLIICDGISQDDINFIKNYKDDRIKIEINKKNMGLINSLNKGISIARGNYIARMDSDDIAYPERLEKQINFIHKHPQYAILAGKADFFDEQGVYGTSKISGEITKKDVFRANPCIHPTMLISKKDIEEIGKYPNFTRCEDYAMVMQMISCNKQVYVMNDIILKYRMDKQGYKKKKFKYRFIETKMKIIYFKKLNASFYEYTYALKPIVAGLIPAQIMQKYLKKKLKNRRCD